MPDKIAVLLKELCCSTCKSDFDKTSIELIRQEESMLVVKLICRHCGKSFGMAFLGISDIEIKQEENLPLKINEMQPINEDDVLDAHKFINNLDGDWQKYIK